MAESSTTAGKRKCSQDPQVDEKLVPKQGPSFCSTRYGIAFIIHICNLIAMAQCVVMNITMVAMVNSTDHQLQFNGSAEGLPGDSFGGLNNAPDSLPAGAPVYDWSPQIQGIIFSSANYGMMLTLALSGYLAGRVGTKRVVGVSLFASSLLSILTPLAAELGLVCLIATRIVQSLIQGSTFGGQYALWERWGPPHERSRLCSIGLSGMMLGTFFIILLGGIICQTLGWPFAFYILGGIGCVYCLLWFVLVYDDPVSHPWINVTEKDYIISSLAHQIQVSPCKQPLPITAMLRSLPIWSMCVCGFGHQWLTVTQIVYTPTYISSVFNVNMRDNGFLSALPFIIAWVFGILGGQMADFLLTKNFRLITVRKTATFLGNFPSSALLVVLPYLTPSYVTTMTLLTLSCGLCAICQSGIYINALDIAPRHSSFLMGATRGFAYVAAILAPTVNGFLLNQDPEFGWRNVFLLLFAINLLGLIFYLIFGEAVVQDWAKERKLTHL
ncbi:sodium-dependent phosphate transport protein 4 isoform X1 [Zalophus californianus]|uniref:Sodium-dependent phosphate transport protein 4 isoform X1 n=1 Tax=Zalophus californianus TaxID=9704 RepID=A0A6J2DNX3_ZALCA|nr:sodium-dependent phosphate transport protein 4 isoform X1 [Zalophus californianus]XP_027963148.1 sodium-dependent phosphate transport protein 4 [Eumetopias jubatus]